MKSVVLETLGLLLPRRCAGCGDVSESDFCDKCEAAIRRINSPLCLRCGLPMPAGVSMDRDECSWCTRGSYKFAVCRSAAGYDGPVKKAVVRFKYGRVKSLAEPLARLMIDFAEGQPHLFEDMRGADAIVPVPIHWRRYVVRRFNQASRIAGPVSIFFGLPVVNALRRTRFNRPQASLNLKERMENVKGAFALRKSIGIEGKKVILIDDVMTSGSTVAECSKVLKKGGAKAVYVFTACRRVLE